MCSSSRWERPQEPEPGSRTSPRASPGYAASANVTDTSGIPVSTRSFTVRDQQWLLTGVSLLPPKLSPLGDALIRRARGLAASWGSERGAAPSRKDDESGAVIILALVFLVAVSLITTALLTWVGGSLHATGNFTDERNVEYAATNAVNLAIQNTRYVFDYGTTNPLSISSKHCVGQQRHAGALRDLPGTRTSRRRRWTSTAPWCGRHTAPTPASSRTRPAALRPPTMQTDGLCRPASAPGNRRLRRLSLGRRGAVSDRDASAHRFCSR